MKVDIFGDGIGCGCRRLGSRRGNYVVNLEFRESILLATVEGGVPWRRGFPSRD